MSTPSLARLTQLIAAQTALTVRVTALEDAVTPEDLDYVTFNLTPPAVPVAEGRVFYNATDHVLSVMTEVDGTSLQLGEESYVRVINKTASQIDDGMVVYLNGAQGQRPKIELADSTVKATKVIGLATHDIAKDAEGRVTTFGLVRDIKTDYAGWAAGDTLYVSSTPGALTKTKPTGTELAVALGTVVVAHPTQGIILVQVRQSTGYLEDLHDVNEGAPTAGDYLVANGTEWNAVAMSGATGARPGSPVAGQSFFDTTIGKPVWWSGAAWVDATGAGA
jgi:hypothetical protein